MSHCCQIYHGSGTRNHINATLSRRWQLILVASLRILSCRSMKSTWELRNPPLTLITPLYLLLSALFFFNRQTPTRLATLPILNPALQRTQHQAHWPRNTTRTKEQALSVPCASWTPSQPRRRTLTARASPCASTAAQSISRHFIHAHSFPLTAAQRSSERNAIAIDTTIVADIRKRPQSQNLRCDVPVAELNSDATISFDTFLPAAIDQARSSDACVAISSSKTTKLAIATMWPLARLS